MRRHGLLLLLAGVLALVGTVAAAQARTLPHRTAAQLRPRPFTSCADLVRYARHAYGRTHGAAPPPILTAVPAPVPGRGPLPAAAGGSASGGVSFSTTNNQEQGVDEPDIVKTDGSTIFTVSGTRVYAVAVGGGAPRQVGSVSLGDQSYGAQLLLRGSRLIAISSGGGGPIPLAAAGTRVAAPAFYRPSSTVVQEIDVSDPAAMKLTRTLTIDGQFVDGRRNGSTARLVISSTPSAIAQPAARGRASGWTPARRFQSHLTSRHYVRPVAPCRAIAHPARFSGLGMLTILTIDLDHGLWQADSDAMMADAQIVYGSPGNLYLATQRWVDPGTPVDRLATDAATVIHQFDASHADRTTYVASGEVPGYLLNQFSLSEYKGRLRVASTSRPIWWGQAPTRASESFVTVLDRRGGSLVPVGRVAGLGTGQRIYSVRFLADRGYVVTFRQIDPLYTLDLGTPTAPRVAGQLELEGYSSYLHPVGRGLLLGIGSAVSGAASEPDGTQLVLFDVSRDQPRLLARLALGDSSSSPAQYDHHAFLFWPPSKLAVLPVQTYARAGSGAEFTGAIGYRVDRSGIAELGRVVNLPPGGVASVINRAIVIGDRLFSISDTGVLASDLGSLAPQGFVALTP